LGGWWLILPTLLYVSAGMRRTFDTGDRPHTIRVSGGGGEDERRVS
jgi:hypothetical protein